MSLRATDVNRLLPRTETVKPMTAASNKENVPIALTKTALDRNNTIVIHHINTFRLLYKIHEQLKLYKPEEVELLQSLANEILTRVNQAHDICVVHVAGATLADITEPEKYFSESANPNFRKYRTVVAEYHRKYNDELKAGATSSNSLASLLKDYLKTLKSISNRQTTMVHWIVEFLLLPKEIRRNHIEQVLEPEHPPTEEGLRNRMRLLV